MNRRAVMVVVEDTQWTVVATGVHLSYEMPYIAEFWRQLAVQLELPDPQTTCLGCSDDVLGAQSEANDLQAKLLTAEQGIQARDGESARLEAALEAANNDALRWRDAAAQRMEQNTTVAEMLRKCKARVRAAEQARNQAMSQAGHHANTLDAIRAALAGDE